MQLPFLGFEMAWDGVVLYECLQTWSCFFDCSQTSGMI